MAQAFLETDFLLRRATPTPARAQAPAASRPVFAIRDPEPDRTQPRSQEIRAQTTRTQDRSFQGTGARDLRTRDTGTQDVRSRDARTEDVRSQRDRPDKSVRSERPPAPERIARDRPASPETATAPTDADPSGQVSLGQKSLGQASLGQASLGQGGLGKAPLDQTGAEVTGAARDRAAAAAAGTTGSPEAAVAATVIAGAGTTVETGAAEETVTDGTEDDGEAAEASIEEPDASLLALGFLPPPPPPPSPVPHSPVHHGAQASTAEDEAPANPIPSSSGAVQPPAGALGPSQGEGPGAAADARPGAATAGKADPAVAVHDAKAAVGEIALPDGLPQVRESFDSLLPGASVASTASTQAPSVAATQPPAPAAAAVPLGAVPMTIGLRSLQGSNHFEIRLDPGDLGRIDVSLDIDKERGTVMAHLVVDRVETLALLQRDTGSLQQALSQAGLDASEANINVSLRSDTQSGGRGADGQGSDGRHPDGRPGGPGLPGQPEGRAALAPVPVRSLRGLTGLDIRI